MQQRNPNHESFLLCPACRRDDLPTVGVTARHVCGCRDMLCINCKLAWRNAENCAHRGADKAFLELSASLERKEVEK